MTDRASILVIRATRGEQSLAENPIVISEITDPEELAKARQRREDADRNWAWLQDHILEIGARYCGKCICVAGQELFVADTPEEVMALARAAHPEDLGVLHLYIRRDNTGRIYVTSRTVATL